MKTNNKSYIRGYFGEKWGYIEGKRYITERNRQEHYCYSKHGWGLELDVYEQLKGLGIEEIVVRCHDGRQTYDLVSDIKTWKLYGVIDRLNPQFGRQIFLAEKYMRRERIEDKPKT